MAAKQTVSKETVEDIFAERSVGELLSEAYSNLVSDAKSGKIAKYSGRDVLIPAVKEPFSQQDAISVRKLLDASQAVFASLFGVSTNTVQAWEQGQTTPNGAARQLYRFIKEDPDYWKRKFRAMLVVKTKSPGATPVIGVKTTKSGPNSRNFRATKNHVRRTRISAAKKAP
jgi:DNA-binding transcriptional regulator YiaG